MKFKKVKTFAEANKDPRVEDAFAEMGNIEDGKLDYWINLKEGYICKSMGCGTIHEQTKGACLDLLNNDVVEVGVIAGE
jgi:hypothetical protein